MARIAETSQLRVGDIIDENGELLQVTFIDLMTRSRARSVHHAKFRHLKKGTILDRRLNPNDEHKVAFFDWRVMEYSYEEGEHYVFMDTETYEQEYIAKEVLGDKITFMRFNDTAKIAYYEGKAVVAELPPAVELEVTYAEDVVRGNTANAVTKIVEIETGIKVRCPAHISIGDIIKIDTRTGEFSERVKKA